VLLEVEDGKGLRDWIISHIRGMFLWLLQIEYGSECIDADVLFCNCYMISCTYFYGGSLGMQKWYKTTGSNFQAQ
jgi:hypothetical protein